VERISETSSSSSPVGPTSTLEVCRQSTLSRTLESRSGSSPESVIGKFVVLSRRMLRVTFQASTLSRRDRSCESIMPGNLAKSRSFQRHIHFV